MSTTQFPNAATDIEAVREELGRRIPPMYIWRDVKTNETEPYAEPRFIGAGRVAMLCRIPDPLPDMRFMFSIRVEWVAVRVIATAITSDKVIDGGPFRLASDREIAHIWFALQAEFEQ